MIDPTLTVAEILKRHPQARAVLARFGLDACCGGAHPLEFACRAHKVDLAEVLAAIGQVTEGAGARDAGPEAIVIDPQMCVRDVIARYPSTLGVFDRHGLMGCGGAQGPIEPLAWFAQVHHVDLPRLMEDLRQAVRSGAPPVETPISPRQLAHENLYRRFLKAALLFTFTGGAALGAWALVLMALSGRLGGIGRGLIQVHGHYQLFGWVGLFVVGVAYHVLPRLTGVPLPSYRLASASFILLVAGTISRTAQSFDPSAIRSAFLVGGALLELCGCALFAWMVGRILTRQATAMQTYQRYLAIGSGWLLISALLNLLHAWVLASRAGFEVPPHLNIPYLTTFLVGFVTSWILGVSLRTLPVFMGLKDRPEVAASVAIPLTASVTVMTIGEASYLGGGSTVARLAFGLGGLGVAVCLALFTWALGILGSTTGEREPGIDRGYEKFLRLGYAWLLISAAMLAAFSVLAIGGTNMDHAFVGAYRHALTVGFITTVMVGMASRIVPVFRGVPLHSARLRDLTFWLLAVGNLMRVSFQSLSGLYGPAWLRVTGVSGILELAGLVLFGINLWKTLNVETAEEVSAAGWRPPIAS
ncbi:MAG TPA: DUF542 domain-containing protein, partial [Candidatus Polarisedimenticolia bacterium]|nr:DUF542 domain-containing protein [Candidatus Polarisedimenticolia bacterium]